MKLPQPSNKITFADAVKLANRVLDHGRDSITQTEKYLLAYTAMATRSKGFGRFHRIPKDRLARVQIAAKAASVDLSESPFQSCFVSFDDADVRLTFRVLHKLKLTLTLSTLEKMVLMTGARILLSSDYRDQFLGDIQQIKQELEKSLPPNQVRRKIWRQALISFWPASKWRVRQLIDTFLKFIGLWQAVEWIAKRF